MHTAPARLTPRTLVPDEGASTTHSVVSLDVDTLAQILSGAQPFSPQCTMVPARHGFWDQDTHMQPQHMLGRYPPPTPSNLQYV